MGDEYGPVDNTVSFENGDVTISASSFEQPVTSRRRSVTQTTHSAGGAYLRRRVFIGDLHAVTRSKAVQTGSLTVRVALL
jgi:hypothetical protein